MRADLSPAANRIEVRFEYDPRLVQAVGDISGARYQPPAKGGPAWLLPLTLDSGRMLREACPEMVLSEALRQWGMGEARKELLLLELAGADDAQLHRLPNNHPSLHAWISGRPYQRADVAFMAAQPAVINANAPGLGKTVECIAAVYESGRSAGAHLVISGKTAMDPVWGDELKRWVPTATVHIAKGTAKKREAVVAGALASFHLGRPIWLVVNPAMLINPRYDELLRTPWDTVIVDEFHQVGLGEPSTKTAKALKKLRSTRKIALSGTPMGGRPIKLWSTLNYLHPGVFTSKWRWAERWLEMHPNKYASSGMQIGDRIKPGLEEEFVRAHQQYMIRRTKAEVLAELPAKNVIDVWCELEGEQLQQYEQFSREAELRMDGGVVTATGILAEYTRLRQLACSVCRVEGETLRPTAMGVKVDQLRRILADHGIGREDGHERAIVFSQFSQLAKELASALRDNGMSTRLIIGETPQEERSLAVGSFEAGLVDVLIMGTKAGGTALTLNRSNVIVFMDETWNPDDQFQAEERNRHQTADIYYLRSKGTIDEDVYNVTGGKKIVNAQVLDEIRRKVR